MRSRKLVDIKHAWGFSTPKKDGQYYFFPRIQRIIWIYGYPLRLSWFENNRFPVKMLLDSRLLRDFNGSNFFTDSITLVKQVVKDQIFNEESFVGLSNKIWRYLARWIVA